MPPRLRWVWPVALAAAVGITASAAAQTFGGRTVPVVKPRASSGTYVTPELFDPQAMIGQPNDAASATAPSASLAPPPFEPVPGSHQIVPAPLARPIEPDIETVKTEPPTVPAEPSKPPPARAAEAPPEKETVRSPAPAKPRPARRPPVVTQTEREERTPARDARPDRDAKASARAGRPATGASPRTQAPPPRKTPAQKTPARKTPAPAARALPSAGATDAQIVAAFKSLELGEQQRVRQRCEKMLANSKDAEAGELRVCRAVSAS